MGRKKGEIGRPSALTPELQEAICAAVSLGNWLETACCIAGVDVSTVRRWVKRGSKEAYGKYSDFRAALKKAMAQAEMRDLETIRVASAEQWQAAAWRLERRWPQRWAAKQEIRELQRQMKELLKSRGTAGNQTGAQAAEATGSAA